MSKKASREEGAAAVEFALVLIPLIAIVFGIIAFGVAYAQDLALSNGARQGARFGAVPNLDASGAPTTSCAGILQQVQNAAGTIEMAGTQVKVTITSPANGQSCTTAGNLPAQQVSDFLSGSNQPCVGSAPGDDVTVDAKFVGSLIIPPFIAINTLNLNATGVYQCEYH